MAKSRSNPAPKVQNIKKVKDGRVKTIFKKSSELYRSMLHNGQGKDCRFTVVVEYSGNCDVFVSDTGRKSTILDFNSLSHATVYSTADFITEAEAKADREVVGRLRRPSTSRDAARPSREIVAPSPTVFEQFTNLGSPTWNIPGSEDQVASPPSHLTVADTSASATPVLTTSIPSEPAVERDQTLDPSRTTPSFTSVAGPAPVVQRAALVEARDLPERVLEEVVTSVKPSWNPINTLPHMPERQPWSRRNPPTPLDVLANAASHPSRDDSNLMLRPSRHTRQITPARNERFPSRLYSRRSENYNEYDDYEHRRPRRL